MTIEIQIEEYQKFLSACINKPDVVLLDRTPMISWVYSSTIPARDKYLGEILQEALDQTQDLAIDNIVILDVEPWMGYARIFLRSVHVGKTKSAQRKRLERFCEQIKISERDTEKIMNYALNSAAEDLPDVGAERPIDLILPYEETVIQRAKFKEIGGLIRENEASPSVEIIDSMNRVEVVICDIINLVRLC